MKSLVFQIIIVAAVSNNGVIGKEGKIPWRIPEDLRRFKQMTTGHQVIVGRKTHESFPAKFCPLPDRLSYVLTGQVGYNHRRESSAIMLPVVSLDAALHCIEHKIPNVENINYEKVFIIGGERVYEEALPLAHRVELTEVDQHVQGDKFFPTMFLKDWQEAAPREKKEGYSFVTYTRK